MKDEQGFDSEETYTQQDNPFWDGTDGAHPAYWRGNDRGVQAISEQLVKIMDDNEYHPEPQMFRLVKRIRELYALTHRR